MKLFFYVLALTAALLGSATVQAVTVSNLVNQAIPDGNPAGMSSTITVAGIAEPIADVTVDLRMSGGYNGDIYAYVSFGGSSVVLLNRVGKTTTDPFGYTDIGFNIRLDDQALTDIHNYGGNGGLTLTGNWQPDGRTADPQNVLDIDPRTTALSLFNGMSPNGQWTLFVADMAGGDGATMTLVDWGLDIAVVPEPANVSWLLPCAFLCARFLVRERRTSPPNR
jgi:subtilisin-like proprotein convertase family protein